ncbi:MAG: hypothetical protein QOH31_2143 [Verrucomicrobiota bacterium]
MRLSLVPERIGSTLSAIWGKRQNPPMAAEELFYAIDVPGAMVYIDTDSPIKAGEVAISVEQKSGKIYSGWHPHPTKEMRDRNLLGAAEDYEGIRYWVVEKMEVK